MQRILAVALGCTCAMEGGCALIANYDFSSYKERPDDGAGGTTTNSAGGMMASTSVGVGGAGGDSTSAAGGGGGAGGRSILVLYEGQENPLSLAVDDTHVYWTTSNDFTQPDGQVRRASKNGGDIEDLKTGQTAPSSLSLNGESAYWFTTVEGNATIHRATKSTGDSQPFFASLEAMLGLAASDQALYWTDLTNAIWRMSVNGASVVPIVLDQNNPSAVTVDATGIFWLNAGHVTMGDGEIMRADLLGANAGLLAGGQEYPLAIATDAANVYWTTLSGQVRTVAKDGANIVTNVEAAAQEPCNDVAVDGTDIYFTRGSDVLKVPIGGVGASVIASTLVNSNRIEVDATSIYVTTTSAAGGSVLKISK